MITKSNLIKVLDQLGFKEIKKDLFSVNYDASGSDVTVDFKNEKIIYPDDLTYYRATTLNFSEPENFVVLECICRLLKKGYKAKHIELEKPMPGGHHDTGGYCDIWISNNEGKTFLLIECKTADEFNRFWKKMLDDGGQLFNYYNSYRQAQALCLYASDYDEDTVLKYTSNIVSMVDNDEYLQSDKKLRSFKDVQEENGGKEEYFKVWETTYQQDYATRGIFEEDIEAYSVGKLKYTINDLEEVDNNSIQKKYHEFATILRQHNVGSHENAFDKLVNLFLAKIVDESVNMNELHFYWKGAAHDDYFSLQDRLQKLYKDGMEKFLGEEVTYIDQAEIDEAFHLFKNDPDATRDKVLEYFRQLKFYTNNDFAFLDVHNETLFYQNAIILKKIVQMLEDIKLKTDEQNQFLGDLFEGFLDQGVKQSEGQYFTPLPIVKFMVSSLPLESIIKKDEIPFVIDYACGAGHFLTEYASEIRPIVEKEKEIPLEEYYERIFGIEKEYRLSKVSKVSAFMYGQDDINIIYGDALANNKQVQDEKFSVLIANPPYSVKGFLDTLSDEERALFELTNYVSDPTTNNSIEVFFVERAKQLLKGKGVAAIVLPSTILSNGNIYIRCREILLKYFHVVAIGVFGSGTFGKTNTNTVTLFLQRRDSNPDISEHYKNRVNSWFSADNSKDVVFEDSGAIGEYCIHCGIDPEEYKAWLRGDDMPKAAIFEDYYEQAVTSTPYKNINKKKITSRFSEEDKKQALANYVYSSIKDIEREKLYYYLLARDNFCDVIVVKSPTESKPAKQFLGYEWSGAKGSEGIKYLGTKQEGEELITQNKGIKSINTPLFDPNNMSNNKKINHLIRNNFVSDYDLVIPQELEDYVSIYRLVDMIDFTRTTFDKSIKTSAVRKVEFTSKYDLSPMGSLVDDKGGLWTGKKPPYVKAHVLRNTNFTMQGTLDLADVAEIDVEKGQLESRTLKKGDIIIEKSGGSENQAVGRVVIISEDLKDYSFSNFTARLRLKAGKENEVRPEYLHAVMNYIYHAGYTFSYQTGSSGLKNLNLTDYLTIRIPVPPLNVQDKIVFECHEVDAEYEKARMSIEDYQQKIEKLFSDLEVITTGGGGEQP